MKLDFSRFHPLDHWPWDPYCRELPGGPRRHLSDAWHYQWRDEITWLAWHPIQKLRCPRGHHHMSSPAHTTKRGFFTGCLHCRYWRQIPPDDVSPKFRQFIERIEPQRKPPLW